MSRWRAIRLVAEREIIERGRSRGYVLSLLFTVALMVVGFVIPSLLVDQATQSTRVTYWEGSVSVNGRVGDADVTGSGYAELTGYAESLGARFQPTDLLKQMAVEGKGFYP